MFCRPRRIAHMSAAVRGGGYQRKAPTFLSHNPEYQHTGRGSRNSRLPRRAVRFRVRTDSGKGCAEQQAFSCYRPRAVLTDGREQCHGGPDEQRVSRRNHSSRAGARGKPHITSCPHALMRSFAFTCACKHITQMRGVLHGAHRAGSSRVVAHASELALCVEECHRRRPAPGVAVRPDLAKRNGAR